MQGRRVPCTSGGREERRCCQSSRPRALARAGRRWHTRALLSPPPVSPPQQGPCGRLVWARQEISPGTCGGQEWTPAPPRAAPGSRETLVAAGRRCGQAQRPHRPQPSALLWSASHARPGDGGGRCLCHAHLGSRGPGPSACGHHLRPGHPWLLRQVRRAHPRNARVRKHESLLPGAQRPGLRCAARVRPRGAGGSGRGVRGKGSRLQLRLFKRG